MNQIVLIATILAMVVVTISADFEYVDNEMENMHGYHSEMKRSYASYCARCLASDDWMSCYKCWDRPGRSVPYYGKKKRNYWSKPGSIIPYYPKRDAATDNDNLFPNNEQDIAEKMDSDFSCKCCLKTGLDVCCDGCEAQYIEENKRRYETSFYTASEEACSCCWGTSSGFSSLLCCLRCQK